MNIWNILLAVLVVQIAIFIHELGHYLLAKKVGASVYEFSVGLGPKIFEFTKKETRYIFRAIPLYGYVLLQQEDDLDNTSTDPNFIKNKGFWSEIGVYIAGPMFNLIFAFVILLAITITTGVPSTKIEKVLPDSLSMQMGLKPEDNIVSINNHKITKWEDIPSILSNTKLANNEELKIKINRDGKLLDKNIVPTTDKDGKIYLGISPKYEINILESFSSCAKNFISTIKENVNFLGDLVFGWVKKSDSPDVELTGPIGTIQVIAEESSDSFLSLASMIIVLNINLGIINLFPLVSILDGGQILIRSFEELRKRPLSQKSLLLVKGSGAVFTLLVMVIVTFKDIIRLF